MSGTILNQTLRSPIDGTENVVLATAGANWRSPLSTVINTLGRQKLLNYLNLYVSTTGNDSNDGLTIGTALATLNRAATLIYSNYDLNTWGININVGAGSFVGMDWFGAVGATDGSFVFLVGAGSASTTITVNGAGGSCINGSGQPLCVLYYNALKLDIGAGVAASVCVFVGRYNQIWAMDPLTGLTDIIYANSGPTAVSAAVVSIAEFGFWSDSEAAHSVTMSAATGGGSWSGFATVGVAGAMEQGDAYTFTGTPNWTSGFIVALGGVAIVYGTFSGATTGYRFRSIQTGNIVGASVAPGFLGPTFLPGDIAGFVDSSSYYDGFDGPYPGSHTLTSTPYVLVLADDNGIVEMNLAGANQVTVPTDANAAFYIGATIWVTQIGAGATTIAGDTGVTVNNAGVVGGQWKSVKLYKRGANEWVQTNC